MDWPPARRPERRSARRLFAARVCASIRTRSRAAAHHCTRNFRRVDQWRTRRRRRARAGLDGLSEARRFPELRRHPPAPRGRQRHSRRARRRLVQRHPQRAAVWPALRPRPFAFRRTRHARRPPRSAGGHGCKLAGRFRADHRERALPRRDLRRAHRAARLAARRSFHHTKNRALRKTLRAHPPHGRARAHRHHRAAARRVHLRLCGKHHRLGAAARPRKTRHRDRAALRRNARSRRHAPHRQSPQRPRHRPLHLRRRRGGNVGAALHLPRLPLRRDDACAGRDGITEFFQIAEGEESLRRIPSFGKIP